MYYTVLQLNHIHELVSSYTCIYVLMKSTFYLPVYIDTHLVFGTDPSLKQTVNSVIWSTSASFFQETISTSSAFHPLLSMDLFSHAHLLQPNTARATETCRQCEQNNNINKNAAHPVCTKGKDILWRHPIVSYCVHITNTKLLLRRKNFPSYLVTF